MFVVRENNDARRVGARDTTPLAERFDRVRAMFEAVRRQDEVVRCVRNGSKLRSFTDNGKTQLTLSMVFECFAVRNMTVCLGMFAEVTVVHARRVTIKRKHAMIVKDKAGPANFKAHPISYEWHDHWITRQPSRGCMLNNGSKGITPSLRLYACQQWHSRTLHCDSKKADFGLPTSRPHSVSLTLFSA